NFSLHEKCTAGCRARVTNERSARRCGAAGGEHVDTSKAKWFALLAALGTGTLAAQPGWAQSDAGAPATGAQAAGTQGAGAQSSEQLQEIVVTARKRSEAVQNVPITEDVFTAQTIQAAGIQSPRDFIAMVPNMTLVETQNIGNSFIT